MTIPKITISTKTKEKIFLVSAFLVIVFTIVTLARYSYISGENQRLAKAIVETKDSMIVYRDKYGVEHAKRQILEVDRNVYVAVYKKKVDSLAQALGIKDKQINSIYAIQTTTNGNINTKATTGSKVVEVVKYLDGKQIIVKDTVKYYDVAFKDRWMDFKGNLTGLDFKASYSLKDSLEMATYWKPSGFLGLGAHKLYLDVKSSNPNTHLTNMSAVELTKERTKHLSVGPYVGIDVNRKPSFGLSLQYSLFKF